MCEADGRQHSFLCPNGTVFSQHLLTCDWWYNVECGGEGYSQLISIYDSELRQRYDNSGSVYGKKMTYKPSKLYIPDYKAPVTPERGTESTGSPSSTLRPNHEEHSLLPRPQALNSPYGTFPKFQLWGKFKTLWLRERD